MKSTRKHKVGSGKISPQTSHFRMYFTNILLGVTFIPFFSSSGFSPLTVKFGGLSTRWTRHQTGCGAPGDSWMSLRMGQVQQQGEDDRSSRVDFLGRVATGISATATGVTLAGLGTGVPPSVADSTGKYSTKATAKKRYLPRIAKVVRGFEQLRKDIDAGSAKPSSEFFAEVLPDSITAMDLYGSSMKRGEYPDSKSRGLQKLATDFGVACEAIAKTLGKGGGDPIKAYDKAAAILADYLKGTELEPIGSSYYES